MPTILIVAPKGGAGASLLAANLAVALSIRSPTLLVDVHPLFGVDDVLLDLDPQQSWAELTGLAGELTDDHLALATCRHASGLLLLAAPASSQPVTDSLPALVSVLAPHFVWLVLDVSASLPFDEALLREADHVLLLITADPPCLRNGRRLMAAVPSAYRRRFALALNQVTPGQPLSPEGAAHALGLPLWASLPRDAQAIGEQVHLGLPAVLMKGSQYGSSVRSLAQRLEVSQARHARPGPDSGPSVSRKEAAS